jgi:hypothetical protein
MNSKAVYIFPYYSYYIEELYKNLDRFNKDDVLYLTSTLYFNILENLNGKEDKLDIYCIWDESNKENLPIELKNTNYRNIFTDASNKKIIFEKLSNKEFPSYKNNLIMFSDVIDIKPSDYEQYFNLLNIED